MSNPSPEISRALAQLEPGRLPLDVFIEVARLTVTPVIEVVPIIDQPRRLEVLLTKRADSDPVWPGMWHTPGTVIRSFDSSVDDGVSRLLRDELGNCQSSEPEYVGYLLHKVSRGTELALVHWVTVSAGITIGRAFDSDNLPENLVDSQRGFISWAISAYLESQAKKHHL